MADPRAKKRLTTRSTNNESKRFVPVKRPERLVKQLHRLLEAKSTRKIEAILIRLHPADIATILPIMRMAEARQLLKDLFRLRKGAATLRELPGSFVDEVLDGSDPVMIAEFARRLEPDDAADILQELDEEPLREVLQILDIDEVRELNALMAYPEDSVGAIMNPSFVALPMTATVDQAISRIRAEGDRLKRIHDLYTVDELNCLTATVNMHSLLLAAGETPLADLVDKNVLSIQTDAPEDEAADIIQKYDLLALPVVSSDGVLVGIITVDDIIDMMEEAATEEMYNMAALDEDDRIFSSPLRSVALRLPWLSLNLFTAIAAAFTVGLFETTISKVVALAAMMPIVAGMGGNAGTQTLTIVIRALALGELRPVNARQAIVKEVTVGFTNGIVIGLMAGLVCWLWKGEWWLGLLLGVSLILNLCMAAIGAATIPLILRRMKLDPALGSSIFLTTLTDIFGFFTFLGLASWLIPYFGIS